jgi:hypothetical protein
MIIQIVFCAIFAGLLFGLWPLSINMSGLSPYPATLAITVINVLVVFPFAMAKRGELTDIKWWYVAGAGIVSAFGMLAFNKVLSTIPRQELAAYFLIMIIMQTAVPVVYDVILAGGVSKLKMAKFALAFISIA